MRNYLDVRVAAFQLEAIAREYGLNYELSESGLGQYMYMYRQECIAAIRGVRYS